METESLNVELGDRSYRILIGSGLIANAMDHLRPLLRRKRVAVVTDANVERHGFLAVLRDSIECENVEFNAKVLPPGETAKSWDCLREVAEWLLSLETERQDVVLALGGGVVGDLAGFAAAILRRGVRHVQFPTTLMSQVDSSVGGKTGINTGYGKNLIGAFHQPSLVLCDLSALDTLPEREFLSGYGEVVKYGLLGSAEFFRWLEINGQSLYKGDRALQAAAVRDSCRMKAEIVAADETEFGRRALLNLGHTFCHALEAASEYSERLRHGEGVAVGCCLAFEASRRLGYCSPAAAARVRAHFSKLGMVHRIADIPGELPSADTLIELMRQDKKVRDGKIRFVLAKGIGQAFVCENADLDVIRLMLEDELAEKAD